MNDEFNSGPTAGNSGDRLFEALEELRAQVSTRPSDNSADLASPPTSAGPCPSVGEWLQLASGGASVEKKDTLLAHAALCSACIARLRESQRALSGEPSPEESAELAQFASTSPEWQHRLAVELALSPHRGAHRRIPSYLLWTSASVVTALLIVFCFVIWNQRVNNPEHMLAEAYTQQRTFDFRIPGAQFAQIAPESHLRGGDTGREPASLLDARARIEHKLERSPNDPHWLQLEARADLLEEKYDAAIDILDRLLAAGPVTAELLADDGAAYFLRGAATSSENDRATALDNLRRADELAPGDPVILFNEALAMEDRGQIINAVETWNRYLKFERDSDWQAEGQKRLKAVEDKLNRLKTHASRMQQHLATPEAMRTLAADSTTLAGIDEELSSTLLPRLLDSAFPMPVDRSRGSPCAENCAAARSLLHALADSLQRNHQDPWLQDFLPDTPDPNSQFLNAAHSLGQAINTDVQGDYAGAANLADSSRMLFHKIGNRAGEDRAEIEQIYALERTYKLAACNQAVEDLLARKNHFPWIDAQAAGVGVGCEVNSGSATEDNPLRIRALRMADEHHYVLLALRARNMVGAPAVESGDTEAAWRFCIGTIRLFYQGDYPPFRVGTTIAGLAIVEDATPRAQLALLLRRESFEIFSLTQNLEAQRHEKADLIRAAIRAGSMQEAQHLLESVSNKSSEKRGLAVPLGLRAESEIAMARLYVDRGDLPAATRLLDQADAQMSGQDNPFLLRAYAVVRGELELARGNPESAESTLRASILSEELQARGAGEQNIIYARQNRDLYAALAGVWYAEHRPANAILALWERYRLRILGQPVPTCASQRLDCLVPDVERALNREAAQTDSAGLKGQIVLHDRVLIYSAHARQVTWTELHLPLPDLLTAATSLERVTSSPMTSQASIDQAARRVGDIFFADLRSSSHSGTRLILEPDPLLGNVPWPAAETADGPIGLRFDLEETPSILLDSSRLRQQSRTQEIGGRLLVIAASAGSGAQQILPEVLQEARDVANAGKNSTLLVGDQVTEPQVASRMASASVLHFAGHATQFDGETRLLLAPSHTPGDKPYLDRNMFLKAPPRAAQLMVFSACATGKREEGWNHGMGDIVDTLASLGVPEVVATRWQIDSASAVPMMNVFYRRLADGDSVPRALTAARESLNQDPRYNHPFYWAAYYASGTESTDLREVFRDNSK